jgi:hypothetical protein
MPILPCRRDGEDGYKWGEGGVCFTGPGARRRAETVGRSIEARRARDGSVGKLEVLLMEEEVSKLSEEELDAALEILPELGDELVPFQAELEISKVDEEQRIVFGFASIVEKEGEEVLDLQGDLISVAELEKAAYEFLENSREGSRMHEPAGQAHAVESFVVTREKAEAMRAGGVLKGDFAAAGWWVGFRVTDDSLWQEVKRGRLPMFSIGGVAQRVPVSEEG